MKKGAKITYGGKFSGTKFGSGAWSRSSTLAEDFDPCRHGETANLSNGDTIKSVFGELKMLGLDANYIKSN